MDKEAAVTMMEAFPPFDWSEVLLKKDLDIFESKIHGYISQVMEKQTKTFVGWMFTGNSILIAAFAAIVIFAK
ncbi:MAG: hypothetical protein WCG15_07130 [Actinomycetes bacterium]